MAPRDPHDPPEVPEPGSDRPLPPHREGVVEAVREEVRELHDRVEGAVEQALPQRARRSAGRIAWLIVLAALGLIVVLGTAGLVWVTRHTEYVAGHLTVVVNRVLADHSDLVLEVKDVRGNPFRSVRIVEPRLRFRNSRGPALLEARSMSLSYAPWDLAFGRTRSLEVQLERPVVRLTRGADGRLRLPTWHAGPRHVGPSREFDVRLTLTGATIELPDSSRGVHGLELVARARIGAGEELEVERMRWERGPWDSRLEELRGHLVAGDSARFVVTRLRTGDLDLSASGGWQRGARTRFAHVELKRLRWGWLARVFDNSTFDVFGEGAGSFDVRLGSGLSGSGTATAVWDSVPLQARADFGWRDGRLTVGPLTGTSPAGDFEGRVVYAAHDLDVSGQVTHGNPAYWHAIGLPGWPAGDLAGRMHYWSWRAEPAGSRFRGDLGGSVLAGWRADSAVVNVDAPSGAAGTFTVAMWRRGGRVDLDADLEHGAWRGDWRAERFPLDEWPDGRASGIRGLLGSGAGTVENRSGQLRVTGELAGSPVTWLGLEAASWSLGAVRGALLPLPDLELPEVRLRDVNYLGVHFDSARARVRVGDQVAWLDDVVAMAGDTVVTVAGECRWAKSGWSTTLARAGARSRQFDWTAEGPLELVGDAAGVEFRRFAARDSAARIEVTGRWAVPGGSYDWTGRASGLRLGRLGLPLDWELSGTADAVLRVTGRAGDPRWVFEGTARQPGALGHRGDSAHLLLAGGPGALEVRDLEYRLGDGALRGDLAFDGTSRPWPDTLTAGGVRAWLATASQWRGRLSLGAFPLDRLDRMVPAARGLWGRLSGSLEIGGRPAEPRLDLKAEAAPVGRDSLQVDRVALRAEYGDGRLSVPELRMTRGAAVSTASGSLPLQLALGSRPLVPEAPMNWKVDLSDLDLAVLPYLAPQLAAARGRLELHGTVAGTPQHPDLKGTAAVRDGEALLTGRGELITGLRADFRLDETRITLDSLFARSGRRGTVRADGVMELEGARVGHYEFRLAMNDFTAVEPGLYAAEFDAPRLRVTDGPGVNGGALPHVEGDVIARAARVMFDFTNQSETEQLAARTQPLFWTYRVRLQALNNLRWQPPDGDIEFSADLTLEQTPRTLNVFGDLNALRGTYDFLSNHFTVQQADLTFDNVGGLNPTLDIVATTRVVPVTGATTGSELLGGSAGSVQPHTITVTITERANAPTIEFASDPADWDQPTILSQLTVARFFTGGTVASQLSDPLESYMTRMINAQLSPLLSRTFLRDVGQWQLEREQGGLFNGRGSLFVTVAHQFNPRMQVSYKQRVPRLGSEQETGNTTSSSEEGLLERNVAAEYRINRFFYVTTELAQRRLQTSSSLPTLVPEFNVNLKARWEY
jgi:hypothetical protein